MSKIQTSDKGNKKSAPLLVLAIAGGFLKKGKHECIYAVLPLTPKKIKFLKKLVALSNSIGDDGVCGEPAMIQARDWSLTWDLEADIKIDASYFHVQGETLWAEAYDANGRLLGRTVHVSILEFKWFDDAPIIWHDNTDSNSTVKRKLGRSFAKESANRMRKLGISIPASLKIKSDAEMRSMLVDLDT